MVVCELRGINDKIYQIKKGFMNWMRSVSMWIIWNVPIGSLAPLLMSFAMNSKQYEKKSQDYRGHTNE